MRPCGGSPARYIAVFPKSPTLWGDDWQKGRQCGPDCHILRGCSVWKLGGWLELRQNVGYRWVLAEVGMASLCAMQHVVDVSREVAATMYQSSRPACCLSSTWSVAFCGSLSFPLSVTCVSRVHLQFVGPNEHKRGSMKSEPSKES